MKYLPLVVLVLGSCLSCLAQSDVSLDGTIGAVDAQLIPTSAADALTKTVNLLGITLTNEGASDTTCILLDKQNTPRSILGSATKPLTVTAGSTYVVSFGFRRRALGGVRWSCVANTVTGYILYESPH